MGERRSAEPVPHSEHRRDNGFTLLEMVMAIGVLGVVMGALAMVMFGALAANRRTSDRLDASRPEQFAAAYFADDAQGAASTGGVVTGGSARCGTETPLIEFRGASFDTSTPPHATMTAVAYVLRDTTVNGVVAQELHRLSCEAPADSAVPLTPDGDLTVARGLAPGGAPAPTVSGATVSITLTPLNGSAFSLVGTRRTT